MDTGQKACGTPKASYAPLGTQQCVGQPQGVCEGGPWGAEENVRAWPYVGPTRESRSLQSLIYCLKCRYRWSCVKLGAAGLRWG